MNERWISNLQPESFTSKAKLDFALLEEQVEIASLCQRKMSIGEADNQTNGIMNKKQGRYNKIWFRFRDGKTPRHGFHPPFPVNVGERV
jgi:hypothetical protein